MNVRAVCGAALAATWMVVSSSSASILVGPITNPANGHAYYLLDPASWDAGEAEAVQLGGHLVTVNDAAEQAWVQGTFGAGRNLWIGLHSPTRDPNPATHAGSYAWSSGEAVGYLNWSPAEPNNVAFEYWAHTWGDPADMAVYPPDVRPAGTWNNIVNSGDYPGSVHVPYGVVELVPEPAAAGLLAVAGLAFARRRRRG